MSAAYLRMLGQTQAKAAKGVGRSVRTIREWEKHPSWVEARGEARERWMADVEDEARAALIDDLRTNRNGDLALKVLERLDPRLRPAKERVEHSGVVTGVMKVPGMMASDDWDKMAKITQERVGGNGHGGGG